MNKDVIEGISEQICPFTQINDTGKLDINSLLPKDGDGTVIGSGAVHIQFMDEFGEAQIAYGYYGQGEYSKKQPEAGWYDESADEKVDYEFAIGEAFQVESGAAVVFSYAGQVDLDEVDVPFIEGITTFGNLRPATVDVQSLTPVTEDGDPIGAGAVHIQFPDEFGEAQVAYGYYGQGEYSKKQPEAGWYDETADERVEYSFEGGEGFLVESGTAGFLRFPKY